MMIPSIKADAQKILLDLESNVCIPIFANPLLQDACELSICNVVNTHVKTLQSHTHTHLDPDLWFLNSQTHKLRISSLSISINQDFRSWEINDEKKIHICAEKNPEPDPSPVSLIGYFSSFSEHDTQSRVPNKFDHDVFVFRSRADLTLVVHWLDEREFRIYSDPYYVTSGSTPGSFTLWVSLKWLADHPHE